MNELSKTDKMTVELVDHQLKSIGYNKVSKNDLTEAIKASCYIMMANNFAPENKDLDIFCEEPSFENVYNYIIKREGLDYGKEN